MTGLGITRVHKY